MLCSFAKKFPPKIADRLGRASRLRRPFREETATEMLLMGLVGLRGLGVEVDFSADEATDGADMEWIFASPLDGTYVRLLIQAKVAKVAKRKTPYWFYEHLDHKKGKQAAALMAAAKKHPAATLALYMMFHPQPATCGATKEKPAIEGVNLVAADQIASKVAGGCGVEVKKVEYWRKSFMPLSRILCWGHLYPVASGPSDKFAGFLIAGGEAPFAGGALWHPDFVAARLNAELGQTLNGEATTRLEAQPIPEDIRRAINGEETAEERRDRRTTRVILRSPLRRDDELYRYVAERE